MVGNIKDEMEIDTTLVAGNSAKTAGSNKKKKAGEDDEDDDEDEWEDCSDDEEENEDNEDEEDDDLVKLDELLDDLVVRYVHVLNIYNYLFEVYILNICSEHITNETVHQMMNKQASTLTIEEAEAQVLSSTTYVTNTANTNHPPKPPTSHISKK